MPTLLDDFLSGDRGRVMHAVWETIRSRDAATLAPLVAALPQLRREATRLDLGGMIYSNNAHLANALTKLEQYRDRECWCAAYPGLLTNDPEKEQALGHVSILSTSDPGWSMTYVTECAVCGRLFDVEQGDHHFMWWRWVPRGVKRSRGEV
ncbi:hypothetical protein AKG07_04285 [Microbacterium sp. CGR1]|uniref:hypothetical protein n=1 Tax=Microbacterium sp. CGR1 TaxID=1696072 RepID=UPI00069E131A|nr:hypothetical protein [Microbacterium sp. CGR1]AKV85636.1 hypothetical protein AKG07_04285 [Microbacterium sp. CGR1]